DTIVRPELGSQPRPQFDFAHTGGTDEAKALVPFLDENVLSGRINISVGEGFRDTYACALRAIAPGAYRPGFPPLERDLRMTEVVGGRENDAVMIGLRARLGGLFSGSWDRYASGFFVFLGRWPTSR